VNNIRRGDVRSKALCASVVEAGGEFLALPLREEFLMRKMLRWTVAVGAMVAFIVVARGDDPANSVKDVMKRANAPAEKGKPSLWEKFSKGKASDDEKKELLSLYKDLAGSKCPRGDEKDWTKRTEALAKAAEAVANGDKGAEAKLKKANDCMGCHLMHKGR
jgi:hypothetical protein